MANKSGAVSKQEKMWQEIEAKRQANRRKQRQKTTVIIALAVVVVLAVIGGIWYGSSSGNKATQGTGVVTGVDPQQAAKAKSVEETQGVLVGKGGTWSANTGVPTIELYYSYGCPACLSFEQRSGEQIQKLATDGKINLVYHPTDTHGLAWTYVAGEAAMLVAEEQPEKFFDFHTRLNNQAYEIMFPNGELSQDQGNGTELADVKASLKLVKAAAKAAGVKEQLIAQFKLVTDPQSSQLRNWSQSWVKAVTEKLGSGKDGGVGTPMFVKNGSRVIDTLELPDPAAIEKQLAK